MLNNTHNIDSTQAQLGFDIALINLKTLQQQLVDTVTADENWKQEVLVNGDKSRIARINRVQASHMQKLLDALILQVVTLKQQGEPIAELTLALTATYGRLTDTIDTQQYLTMAKMLPGNPSTGMKVLGAIMIAIGVAAIGFLLAVIFPASLSILGMFVEIFGPYALYAATLSGIGVVIAIEAAVTATIGVTAIVGGLCFFNKGSEHTGLSKTMYNVDDQAIRNSVESAVASVAFN